MNMQYECDSAFSNLKCVPEPFLLEKSAGNDTGRDITQNGYIQGEILSRMNRYRERKILSRTDKYRKRDIE